MGGVDLLDSGQLEAGTTNEALCARRRQESGRKRLNSCEIVDVS